MKLWLKAATPEEQEDLATHAETSRAYLHHLGGGFRKASATIGGRIEKHAAVMHRRTAGRLPLIYRTDLVEACKHCPYARQCLGTIAESVPVEDSDD